MPRKSKGYAQRGRPAGTKLPARTIERIRDSINSKLTIDTLHQLCESGGQHDGVRATAALGLLKKVLPDLTATDHTTGGEPFVIERVMFKSTKGK